MLFKIINLKSKKPNSNKTVVYSKTTKLTVTVYLQDLESQSQQESDTAQDTIASLEDNVNEEKQRREDAEQELLKQKRVRDRL